MIDPPRLFTSDQWEVVYDATTAIGVHIDTQMIVLATINSELLFGYYRGELRGKPLKSLIPFRFHENHDRNFEIYAQNPKPRRLGENTGLFGLRKNGSEFRIAIGLSDPRVVTGVRLVIAELFDLTPWVASEGKGR